MIAVEYVPQSESWRCASCFAPALLIVTFGRVERVAVCAPCAGDLNVQLSGLDELS